MSSGKKFRVEFRRQYPGLESSRYVTYEFMVAREADGEEEGIEIDISLTFQMKYGTVPDKLGPIAAKAVELHLLGKVPADSYRQERENAILLDPSTWYPGGPGEPHIVEDWNEFEVIPPKPELGFKTPSNT